MQHLGGGFMRVGAESQAYLPANGWCNAHPAHLGVVIVHSVEPDHALYHFSLVLLSFWPCGAKAGVSPSEGKTTSDHACLGRTLYALNEDPEVASWGCGAGHVDHVNVGQVVLQRPLDKLPLLTSTQEK